MISGFHPGDLSLSLWMLESEALTLFSLFLDGPVSGIGDAGTLCMLNEKCTTIPVISVVKRTKE